MIISTEKKGWGSALFTGAFLLASLLSAGCFNAPAQIPTGAWNYALLLNGTRVGKAAISSREEGNGYVTTTELIMQAGSVTNVSKQVVTETKDYVPVKLETHNKIIIGGNVQDIRTVAVFNGRRVELTSGGEKSIIELTRDFRLEGHYMMSKLIQGKFRKGMEVESWIYEPSIDPDAPVLMKARVAGQETVTISGKEYPAIRVVEYIARFKSFDMYLDGTGALLKADLTMLNMNIQLVREP